MESGSHDKEEEERNLSGVSDISMDSSRGHTTPPTAGPQTPPTPGGTPPTGNPTGVSDISSDTVGSSQNADVSITEEGVEMKSADTSASSPVGTTPPVPALVEGEAVERDGASALEAGGGESVAGRGVRPPPLDSLGPLVAPSSPLSTQTTPSKTPGKRKVCDGWLMVLL